MKAIYKYYLNCGRMGSIGSLFIADMSEVNSAIGSIVRFDEVLGKHSYTEDILTESSLNVLSTDQEFIRKFEEIMGSGTISGHNPLDNLQE